MSQANSDSKTTREPCPTCGALPCDHVLNPADDPIRQLLSEGLDLCVRARQLDSLEDAALERAMRDPHRTRSGTIPMWMHEQYETDRADWEVRARKSLS